MRLFLFLALVLGGVLPAAQAQCDLGLQIEQDYTDCLVSQHAIATPAGLDTYTWDFPGSVFGPYLTGQDTCWFSDDDLEGPTLRLIASLDGCVDTAIVPVLPTMPLVCFPSFGDCPFGCQEMCVFNPPGTEIVTWESVPEGALWAPNEICSTVLTESCAMVTPGQFKVVIAHELCTTEAPLVLPFPSGLPWLVDSTLTFDALGPWTSANVGVTLPHDLAIYCTGDGTSWENTSLQLTYPLPDASLASQVIQVPDGTTFWDTDVQVPSGAPYTLELLCDGALNTHNAVYIVDETGNHGFIGADAETLGLTLDSVNPLDCGALITLTPPAQTDPLDGTWAYTSDCAVGSFLSNGTFQTTFVPEDFGTYNLTFTDPLCGNVLHYTLHYCDSTQAPSLLEAVLVDGAFTALPEAVEGCQGDYTWSFFLENDPDTPLPVDAAAGQVLCPTCASGDVLVGVVTSAAGCAAVADTVQVVYESTVGLSGRFEDCTLALPSTFTQGQQLTLPSCIQEVQWLEVTGHVVSPWKQPGAVPNRSGVMVLAMRTPEGARYRRVLVH